MNLFTKSNIKALFQIFAPALLGLLLFYNISYTDDIEAYYLFYLNNDVGDFGFQVLENLGHWFNLSFLEFENLTFFIILSLFSFVFFKFGVNTFIGVLLTILLNYVQIANQLRYFIAVPLLLLAIYYFFVEEKRITSCLLAVVAFLFHSGIIAWISFIPIGYYLKCKEKKDLFRFFSIIGVVIFLAYSTLSGYLFSIDSKYETYITDRSSALGSIFVLLYPLFCISWILLVYKGKVDSLRMNNPQILGYVMSIFTVVWIIASFTGFQIINARYVNAFFVVWIIAIYSSKSAVEISNKYAFFFSVGAIFFKQIFPIIISGFIDSDLYKITLIWQSRFTNLLY